MYAFIHDIIVHFELYSLGYIFHLIFKNFVYVYTSSKNDLHEFSTKTCCTCITIIQFLHFLFGVLMALFEFSRYINFLSRANQAISYPPS